MERLKRILERIDGKGYSRYKELRGEYKFPSYTLIVDYVQPDPFAPPSKIKVRIPQKIANFPSWTYSNKSRRIALEDFIARNFKSEIKKSGIKKEGSGKSGLISIEISGQEILERNCVVVNKDFIEVRFKVGLPAYGRKIAGKKAIEIFFEKIPAIVKKTVFYSSINTSSLKKHIETNEDADYLRRKLKEMGLVAFVADGAILPRKSGISSEPLKKGAVPFISPESLRVEIELPNRGKITGMGIKEGVTLIVGGGYHGKTTLLNGIELGIYNHIPEDGREFVITNPLAFKIRAEDGRNIEKVNISPFIKDLPFGKGTETFTTENASGSTSQAANIIEAIEAGAEVLLIDEDTSATNFMIRDKKMQQLVSKDKEPITPFIDRVRELYEKFGVSTIMVMGGVGDYFEVADCVICMVEYRPYDYTFRAKEIAEKYRGERKREVKDEFSSISHRVILKESFEKVFHKGEKKVKVKGIDKIVIGREIIDLSFIEQIVDSCQTKAIGYGIYYMKRYVDGKKTLREIIEKVEKDIQEKGLDILSSHYEDFAIFRKLELAAAINRLRSLKMR